MLSLNDLDVTKACEQEYEFEVKDDATGKGTGIFLTVIGGLAPAIAEYQKKVLNERRVAEKMAEKRDPRGKNPKVTPIEDDIEFSTELVAMRVTKWRGISDPFSHDNVVKLCTINPPIKEQILAVSDDLKNFPTPFSTKPASTSGTPPG